jgi:hypothetical protein
MVSVAGRAWDTTMHKAKIHLIGVFEHQHPLPGQEIDHDGRTWLITDVAQISGRWFAWGHPVTDDEGGARP